MRNVSLVILLLGLSVIIGVVGIVILAVNSHPVPDVLANVTIAGVGALAGILARPDSPPNP